ncbi:hypothetical protein MCUN1_003912 [Malassezia cuniculi]|uniref:Thiol-specific monooxygenase n=1 Tax=Malassezia cuniculi TaxID=948313 RepID=A0AAF0J8E2_9BASI|nr:hypothetical protein MCUN1_003912 [Malassezia cuniculi]
MSLQNIKRVAIIGAGASGVIALDAALREQAFDVVRCFERRERAGGVWLYDEKPNSRGIPLGVTDPAAIDPPLTAPATLPAYTPPSKQERYHHTPTYSYLETNIDAHVMEFSQEPVPDRPSEASIAKYGKSTPFRHHTVMQQYLEGITKREGYEDHIEYNTTVEKAAKEGGEWVLTLRRSGARLDYWWQERFDAVIVAIGHYNVPIVPNIPGLVEIEREFPGIVEHTKYYRGRDNYTGQHVVVVGGSVSAMDTAYDLIGRASKITSVVRSRPHVYFTDTVFTHPQIDRRPEIERIDPKKRDVYFKDGSVATGVDRIVLGTGYRYSYPFLEGLRLDDNRVNGLYLHVFSISDPTLAFVGAIAAGLTFKAFEWQAVLAVRAFAGRAKLPPVEEQRRWETDRIKERGNGTKFTLLYPHFAEYFNFVREIAGNDGPGRKLPVFNPKWAEDFNAGHQLRINWWKQDIERAKSESQATKPRAHL